MPFGRNRLHHGLFVGELFRGVFDRFLSLIGCCLPNSIKKERKPKKKRSQIQETVCCEPLPDPVPGMAVCSRSISTSLLRLLELIHLPAAVVPVQLAPTIRDFSFAKRRFNMLL